MQTSEQINELATALCKAQGTLAGAKKDSANPFYKSTYADLESVWSACREALAKNGLSVIQTVSTGGDGVSVLVATMLAHNSGQWIKDTLALNPKDSGPQAMGSCISYGRRYALAAIVGVYQTDDDAEAAHGRKRNDAKGEPQREVAHSEVETIVTEFRTAMGLDAPEEDTAAAVFAVHSRIATDTDLYCAVGDAMTAKERAAIKACVTLHKKNAASAYVNGRGR